MSSQYNIGDILSNGHYHYLVLDISPSLADYVYKMLNMELGHALDSYVSTTDTNTCVHRVA